VVTNGVEGFLAECGNIDQMVNRALLILTDDAARAQMGQRARLTARARFCATKIIPQYEAYYQKILDQK
jgi:glycosyltransferase involved in cell wall biosynthesis